MSISLRGMKRSQAAPLPGAGEGNWRETTNSPGPRTFVPGPVLNASMGTRRRPPGPATLATAERTIIAGTESAAGPELQGVPPGLAGAWGGAPPTTGRG